MECDSCGVTLPDGDTYRLIHIQQEHPAQWEGILDAYRKDVIEYRVEQL